jgi:type IV pilus assembly protein PilQ
MRVSCGAIAVLCLSLCSGTVWADESRGAVATLHVAGQHDRAELTIAGTFDKPAYSIDALNGGKQIVILLDGATLAEPGVSVDGSAQLIVRSTASSSAKGVRVVVQLTQAASYRARAEDGKVHVYFESLSAAAADRDEVETSSDSQLCQVKYVGVERRNGRERVVIDLDRHADFRVIPGGGPTGPARMEIEHAQPTAAVPAQIRASDTGVVRSIKVVREGEKVLLAVDRAAGSTATAIREGHRIVWLFAGEPTVRGQARLTETIAREAPTEIDGEEVAAFLSDVPLQVGVNKNDSRYTGRRIDLDFKDADIHNILRLLSEVGNVNVVTADDVSGSVTIKMRAVPWDQALDVILTSKGLGMVRRGNLIRVAPQTTLEKERELAIAREKQRLALAPLETRLIPVSYATAQTLQPRVNELLSERGKVAVDERTNMLVVRDIPENLESVEELVRSLDTQTPQVLIEARIIEARTSFSNEFGIQWGGDVVMSSATGNPTGLVFPHDLTLAGGATDGTTPTQGLSPFGGVPNPNFVVNLPAPAGTGRGAALGLSMGSLSGNINFSLRLSAFETTGQVRIISAPRVLTLDNHSATISQGTSIPYSQVGAQGVQTTFQEAVLSLNVTPHVTNDGAVSMDVKISRNEPDFNQRSARGDPTILKRQAQTYLLVQDGHTAVIGGIYTRNTGRSLDQIPLLGDIPILGVIFQHHVKSDQRNELLIFLTPRIVNRGEALSH